MISAQMAKNLGAYWSLYRFSIKRDDGVGKLLKGFLTSIIVISLALAWFMPEFAVPAKVIILLAFGGLLFRFTMLTIIGILLQNSPANAGAVPNMHRKLKMLATCLFLSSAVFYSYIVFLLFGHFWISLFSSLLLLSSMSWFNGKLFGIASVVAAGSSSFWIQFLLDSENTFHIIGLLIALTLIFLYFSVRHLVRDKGDGHFRAYQSLHYLLRQANPSDDGRQAWGQNETLARIFSFFYFVDLRKLTTQAKAATSKASAQQLMGLAFGPGAHWGIEFLINALLMITFVFLYSIPNASSNNKELFMLKFMMSALPIMIGFSFAMSCKIELFKTRREQAMLRLVPVMPSGEKINQCFAQFLLRRFAISWCMVAFLVALLGVFGLRMGLTNILSCSAALLLQPVFLLYVLRDYRTLNQSTVNDISLVGVVLIIVGICIALNFEGEVIARIVASLFAACTLCLLVCRWQAFQRGTPQLPVGQNAG